MEWEIGEEEQCSVFSFQRSVEWDAETEIDTDERGVIGRT